MRYTRIYSPELAADRYRLARASIGEIYLRDRGSRMVTAHNGDRGTAVSPFRATVAILTRGRPVQLAELVPIVIAQLPLDAELLILDDDPEGYAAAITDIIGSSAVRTVRTHGGGLVDARNLAVLEARGAWLVFLDDDQVPLPGWLPAMMAAMQPGMVALFGRVVARLEAMPPPGLAELIERLFSRELPGGASANAHAFWTRLGAGNSAFYRPSLPGPAPFNSRFARAGGEDLHLVRRMMAEGCRLGWVAEASVEERVPFDRMNLTFLRRRKFVHGQLRVRFEATGAGPLGLVRAAIWTAAGAGQAIFHGAAFAAFALVGHARAASELVRFWGGLGKLAWWRPLLERYGDNSH